jgi:hypothetical protein
MQNNDYENTQEEEEIVVPSILKANTSVGISLPI